jgi:hypothetical protein
MDYIESGLLRKQPHELIELTIIVEFLYDRSDAMKKERNEQIEFAEKKGVPRYLINIFTKKLNERIELIDHLAEEVNHKRKDFK